MLPAEEFTRISELVGHLVYNPFRTILDPLVLIREYADLAFVGTFRALHSKSR